MQVGTGHGRPSWAWSSTWQFFCLFWFWCLANPRLPRITVFMDHIGSSCPHCHHFSDHRSTVANRSVPQQFTVFANLFWPQQNSHKTSLLCQAKRYFSPTPTSQVFPLSPNASSQSWMPSTAQHGSDGILHVTHLGRGNHTKARCLLSQCRSHPTSWPCIWTASFNAWLFPSGNMRRFCTPGYVC